MTNILISRYISNGFT